MKTNRQTRIFARQVQVDLLALPDADLFRAVQQWIDGEPSGDISPETRFALGYTLNMGEAYTPSLYEGDAGMQWLPPATQQLRGLLAEMDLKLFVQHVLPLAFQSLHEAYPEWGEGSTFNAHLANHLRLIGMKR